MLIFRLTFRPEKSAFGISLLPFVTNVSLNLEEFLQTTETLFDETEEHFDSISLRFVYSS